MNARLLFVLTAIVILGALGIEAGTHECPTVVKVFFDDPDRVSEISWWVEPWEVHPDQGYLIVDVYRDGLEYLRELGFEVEIDIERTHRLCQPRQPLPGQKSGLPGLPCYRTLEETAQVVADMIARFPDLVERVDIGDSWEKLYGTEPGFDGHDLRVLRLTNRNLAGTGTPQAPQSKPVLFAIAGIHARECPPQELVLRFAEHLVYGYGRDADATWLLDEHEIHLMLNANPDGRQRAQELIYWRKNANNDHCSDTDQRGVDLNRNFAWAWGSDSCSSTDPCHELFRGSGAASEPETQAIASYLTSVFPLQDAHGPEEDLTGVFFDLHSYGEWVSWSWFHSSVPTANNDALQTLGRKLAFLNGYDPSPPTGGCGGLSVDYAYGSTGVAGYLMELGDDFFESCESFEQTVLPGNLQALIYAAKVARSPFWTPAGPDITAIEIRPGPVLQPGTSFEVHADADESRFNDLHGEEPQQPITAVELTIDQPPWSPQAPAPVAMDADDGVLYGMQEGVWTVLNTSSMALGRHTLFVRAQDASGHWGAVSAAFLWVSERDTRPRRARGRID